MELTLKELFENYPIIKNKIALRLGYTQYFFNKIVKSKSIKETHLKAIEHDLQELGRDLLSIKLISEDR